MSKLHALKVLDQLDPVGNCVCIKRLPVSIEGRVILPENLGNEPALLELDWAC